MAVKVEEEKDVEGSMFIYESEKANHLLQALKHSSEDHDKIGYAGSQCLQR